MPIGCCISWMDDELLNVVDRRDRVIAHRRRAEVHRLGLLHQAAHVLLFNRKGEVFLQKRSLTKDNNPGLWDSSASGHVDAGEGYDACALREVEEELGVRLVQRPQRLFKLPACEMTGMEFCQVYRALHDGPFRLNMQEIETGRWICPEALDAWLDGGGGGLTETLKAIWRRLRDEPPENHTTGR